MHFTRKLIVGLVLGVLLLSGFLAVIRLNLPSTFAASGLAQENNGSAQSCSGAPKCSAIVDFPNPVTAGDVVAVAIYDLETANLNVYPPVTVIDSLSSSYSQACSKAEAATGGGSVTFIYAATLASSGSDNVNVTISSGYTSSMYFSIFEVSGVTLSGVVSAQGAGYCCSTHTGSVSYASNSFLLAVVG